MEQYFSLLKKVPLFRDVGEDDIPRLLGCLTARLRSFEKGEMIFSAGQPAQQVGIVCAGAVHVFTEDFMGNRTILTALPAGEIFGEAFACAGTARLPVSVMAVESSDILLINYRKIVSACSETCVFHSRLIENMLGVVAAKNVALSQRVDIISKRSTREKLTAYLSAQSLRAGSRKFTIPFDRQALADFLCVERSAMSAELSKMQRDGLLVTRRREFELLEEVDALQ